jgi:cytoskeletal protein CcmA (bactofilin family)
MGVLPRSFKASHQAIADRKKELQTAPPRSQEQHCRTVISATLSVIGSLEGATDLQVDGKVEGDISGQAVRIGSGAVVMGTVTGEIVELAGTIEGKIDARSAVLAKTANMSGDIIHESLQIDQGALFNGNSRQS